MLRPRRLTSAAAIQIATLSTLNAARRGCPSSANIGTKPAWATMPTQATLRMTAAMRGGGGTTAGMPVVTRRTGPVAWVPVVDTQQPAG